MEEDDADSVKLSSCLSVFDGNKKLAEVIMEEFTIEDMSPPLQALANANKFVNDCLDDQKGEYEQLPVLENEIQSIKMEPSDDYEYKNYCYRQTATHDKTNDNMQTGIPNTLNISLKPVGHHVNLCFTNRNDCNDGVVNVKSEQAFSEEPQVHIETDCSQLHFPHFENDPEKYIQTSNELHIKLIRGCENLTDVQQGSITGCTLHQCEYKGLPNPFVKIEPLDSKTLSDGKWFTQDRQHVKSRHGRIIKNTLWKHDYTSLLSVDEVKRARRRALERKSRSLQKRVRLDAKKYLTYPHATDPTLASARLYKQLEADQKALMSVPLENEQEQCVPVYLIQNRHFDSLSYKKAKVPVPGVFEESEDMNLNQSSSNSSYPLGVSEPTSEPSCPLNVSKPTEPVNYQGEGNSDVDVETDWDSSTFKMNSLENLQQEEHNYCSNADQFQISKVPVKGKKKGSCKKNKKKKGYFIQVKKSHLRGIDKIVKEQDRNGQVTLEIIGDQQARIVYPEDLYFGKMKAFDGNRRERERRKDLRTLFRDLSMVTNGKSIDIDMIIPKRVVIKQAKQEIYLLMLKSMELNIIKERLHAKNKSMALYLKEKMQKEDIPDDISEVIVKYEDKQIVKIVPMD